MKAENLVYALGKFEAAFTRLERAVEQVVDDLDRDGAIQRFEFTFELLWKTAKIFLEYEGFRCAGPRSCIKEGARREILLEGEVLLDMLEDRNKTTHIYDEHTAEEIFERIKNRYVPVIASNIRKIGEQINPTSSFSRDEAG
ncbi:MAG: nucleotidyltransferase substrate binding protein [Chloroflexota bacterium]|nr:nucleotidyltransferase substrate binding protein [Chloroflexota bacterium]